MSVNARACALDASIYFSPFYAPFRPFSHPLFIYLFIYLEVFIYFRCTFFFFVIFLRTSFVGFTLGFVWEYSSSAIIVHKSINNASRTFPLQVVYFARTADFYFFMYGSIGLRPAWFHAFLPLIGWPPASNQRDFRRHLLCQGGVRHPHACRTPGRQGVHGRWLAFFFASFCWNSDVWMTAPSTECIMSVDCPFTPHQTHI